MRWNSIIFYRRLYLSIFCVLVIEPQSILSMTLTEENNIFVLTDVNSVRWVNSSNVLFITSGDANHKLRDQLVAKYKSFVFNDKMSEEDIIKIMKTKSNHTNFVMDIRNDGLRSIVQSLNEMQFFVIIVGDVGNLFFSSWLPFFVGWTWSNRDRRTLKDIRGMCYKQLMDLKVVKPNEMVNQKMRFHVTTTFIGHTMNEESKQYLRRVSPMFYSTSRAVVTGILLTPRTFSGHVVLDEAVKYLSDSKEQELFHLLPHVTLAVAPGVNPVQSGPDQVAVQRLIAEGKVPKANYTIKLGQVQDWGEDRLYVTLKRPLAFDLMFCPHF